MTLNLFFSPLCDRLYGKELVKELEAFEEDAPRRLPSRIPVHVLPPVPPLGGRLNAYSPVRPRDNPLKNCELRTTAFPTVCSEPSPVAQGGLYDRFRSQTPLREQRLACRPFHSGLLLRFPHFLTLENEKPHQHFEHRRRCAKKELY